MNNAIVVLAGDTHINSTVALCPPIFTLDDGGEYRASRVQKFIWNHWLSFWQEIEELANLTKYPVYTFLNGDVVDDLNHQSTQLITRNPADQVKLANLALKPAHDVTNHYFVVRGTEAHSGPSGNLEEILADDINAVPDGENKSWSVFRGKIAGVRFDALHHPGMGHARPWTRGGDANRLAAKWVYNYAEWAIDEPGLEWPQVIFFNHNHKPVDSYDNHPIRVIISPSWQLSTTHGFRLGGDPLPIGGLYAVFRNGKIQDVRKHYKRWPIKDEIWIPQNLAMTN